MYNFYGRNLNCATMFLGCEGQNSAKGLTALYSNSDVWKKLDNCETVHGNIILEETSFEE